MKKAIGITLMIAASTLVLAARPEVKPRLIGLLDGYTENDGRVVLAVVASEEATVSQAAVQLTFSPEKLALVDARGRSGVAARVVEQDGRTVVQFWPQKDGAQAGMQVLGYLEFRNLKGREYAEVLVPKGWVNGVETAPAAARVHPERRAQFHFMRDGVVAIPVAGGATRVSYDESQLEFLKSVPEGFSPEPERRERGNRSGRHIRLAGSEDEVTVLFFRRLETDPRRQNEPIRLSVGEK